MSGDVHVRICEHPRGKFPRVTRLVIIFQRKDDAERVKDVIPKRFGKYGLTVHPDKTRLVDFRSPKHSDRRREAEAGDDVKRDGKPGTFDLLGFTHYWDKTRKGGQAVKRKTMKSRVARSIHNVDQWCSRNRHKPICEQWKKLCEKVRGHYGYYGITRNARSLGNFLYQVRRNWQRWLNRRNNRRDTTWERFNIILERYTLPTPKIVHSVFQGK